MNKAPCSCSTILLFLYLSEISDDVFSKTSIIPNIYYLLSHWKQKFNDFGMLNDWMDVGVFECVCVECAFLLWMRIIEKQMNIHCVVCLLAFHLLGIILWSLHKYIYSTCQKLIIMICVWGFHPPISLMISAWNRCLGWLDHWMCVVYGSVSQPMCVTNFHIIF